MNTPQGVHPHDGLFDSDSRAIIGVGVEDQHVETLSTSADAIADARQESWSPPPTSTVRSEPTASRAIARRRHKEGDHRASAPHIPLDAGWSIRPEGNRRLSYRLAKRLIDIGGALLLVMLLSPVMLATLLVLLITTRGRPLFIQRRSGYLGRPFSMLKFRTMRLDAERSQYQIKNEQEGPVFKNRRDPRVTRVGRILRSFSIDETPQLVNVLLGQMSLVGPRPPLPEEVAQYKPWQRRRLAVKPGLTCLWQVSGRCEIGFDDWVRMDIWYSRHQKLSTDLALLLRTPMSVLSRRGAY